MNLTKILINDVILENLILILFHAHLSFHTQFMTGQVRFHIVEFFQTTPSLRRIPSWKQLESNKISPWAGQGPFSITFVSEMK